MTEDGMSGIDAMQRALKTTPKVIGQYLSPPPMSPRAAPRVLLLTSTLGSGHLRAAQAVEAGLLERCPAARIETLDFWSLMDQGVAQAVRQTYLRLMQEHPELYDRIYQVDQTAWRPILESGEAPLLALTEALALLAATSDVHKSPPGSDVGRYTVDRVLIRLLCAVLKRPSRTSSANGALLSALIKRGWIGFARRMDTRVRVFAPDVVVATQMTSAALFSLVKKRRRLAVPTLGVVTDFGMHDFWIQPGIDGYCVGHESIAGLGEVAGEPSRILATGIPLMPEFRKPPGKCEARMQLRLNPDMPVVLVLGGGLGLGVDAITKRLLMRSGHLQLLALVGHSAAARESLAPLLGRYPGRLRVWDWTEQMTVLIRAADVVVGKPGGLTVAEVLACGRPLLATRSLRGQEGFNTRFLEQHGVGVLMSEDVLAQRVESLLANRRELAQIQHRAWMLGKRDAAARIAEVVLAFAQSASDAETVHAR